VRHGVNGDIKAFGRSLSIGITLSRIGKIRPEQRDASGSGG
jgi:hypothetical protein